MSVEFDPVALAREIADGGLSLPGDDDLPDFGPNGIVQAAITTITAIVSAWLVGEGHRFDEDLARAARWADEADGLGLAYGGDDLLFTVQLKRARAVAHWLLEGGQPRPLWRSTADASERLWRRERDVRPLLCPLYDVLVDRLLAGEAPAALALFEAAPEGSRDPLSRSLVAILSETDPRARAAAMRALLAAHAPHWLGYLPHPNTAEWLGLAFAESGLTDRPETALATIYALMPGLALPPAMLDRGWSDKPHARTRLVGAEGIGRLDRLLLTLGLVRDPDSTPQAAQPAFASWTRQPGLETEVDWHRDGVTVWIEARGDGAGRIAALVAETLGGRIADDDSTALADLLTIPSSANAGAGKSRWEILAAVLRAVPEADRETAAALVAAGLRDPDWRVRMTAVWGVGLLRLAPLADEAAATALPPLGYEGLSGEDRRTLLALREAARNRGGGHLASESNREGGGPGGTARVAFVAKIAALFERLEPPAADRDEALLMALLGIPGQDPAAMPRTWRPWFPRPARTPGAKDP